MRLVILGAGGYGKMIADMALQFKKVDSVLFLDDGDNEYDSCASYYKYHADMIYPAFGNNEIRLEWIEKLKAEGYSIFSFIHPSAFVSHSVSFGVGCVVLAMAVINTNTIVEDGCIINSGAIVDHDCLLEKGVHVCIHSTIKANNKIETCEKIEAGCVVENGNWKR